MSGRFQTDVATTMAPLPTEREVQKRIVALYRAVGCHVGVFSENRQSRIPPGWPDLVVMAPLRISTECTQALWFHETKSATGRLSTAQEILHERLRLRGLQVVVGGQVEAQQWLQKVGLLKVGAA